MLNFPLCNILMSIIIIATNDKGLVHFCFAVLVDAQEFPQTLHWRRHITFTIASPSHEAFREELQETANRKNYPWISYRFMLIYHFVLERQRQRNCSIYGGEFHANWSKYMRILCGHGEFYLMNCTLISFYEPGQDVCQEGDSVMEWARCCYIKWF